MCFKKQAKLYHNIRYLMNILWYTMTTENLFLHDDGYVIERQRRCIWCVFDLWHIICQPTFCEHLLTLKNVIKLMKDACLFSSDICRSSNRSIIKKIHAVNQFSSPKTTSGCSNSASRHARPEFSLCEKNYVCVTMIIVVESDIYW